MAADVDSTTMQAEAIVANLKVALGSDLRVDSRTGSLNEDALARLMAAEMALPGEERAVQDYAWASWPLWNIDPPVYRVFLTNLVSFPRQYNAETVAVSSNYLEVTYGEYFSTASSDGCHRLGDRTRGSSCVAQLDVPYGEALKSLASSRIDVLSGYAVPEWCKFAPRFCDEGEQAYGADGYYIDALVPASLVSSIGAEVGTPLVTAMVCQNQRQASSSRVRQYVYLQVVPKAIVRKMPGYLFSSFELLSAVADPIVVVGPSTYQQMFDKCVQASGLNATALGLPSRPAKRTLHIRLSPAVSHKQRIRLQNRIRSMLDENGAITDTIMYAELAAGTVDMLMVFFYVLSGIACVLCFFMLHINFESNVRDNLWEFGVLRALGINRRQLTRIFIYESLSVIISAILIGTCIGFALATILTLQQNIFTELPFKIVLPGWLFLSTVVLSILVAALGAYFPVSSILPWSIARILKQT
jgi:hypothetical protein